MIKINPKKVGTKYIELDKISSTQAIQKLEHITKLTN